MAKGQRGAGGRLRRSEVFTIRMDPRTRWGVALAAQKEHRTASQFVDSAISEALDRVEVSPAVGKKPAITVFQVLRDLWSLDELERLRRLKELYPELLSPGEMERLEKETMVWIQNYRQLEQVTKHIADSEEDPEKIHKALTMVSECMAIMASALEASFADRLRLVGKARKLLQKIADSLNLTIELGEDSYIPKRFRKKLS